jgi:SAM-dependent methyltransferase
MRRKQKLAPTVRRLVTRAGRRLVNALDPSIYLECLCCGELAPTFLPHGVKTKPNRKCPSCGSLPRHRMRWMFLHEHTNLFTSRLEVLHFAPELGLQRRLEAAPKVTYHSADLTMKRAAEHFDICAIPYPDDTFDVILCSHVLEHVPDDRKAMSELFRVMKPGGWGLIEVPYQRDRKETFEDPGMTSDADRERLFGQWDHVRRYGIDYFDRLRAAGFEVTRHDYAKQLPAAKIAKYRLLPSGVIHISTKPAR